jgi:sensor c-di-GMP phosphodiesterase-like protein
MNWFGQFFRQHLLKNLSVYWIIFTLIILPLCLYVHWVWNTVSHYDIQRSNAKIISKNIDGFIDDLLQEIKGIPSFDKNKVDCDKIIYPYLQHITINNPKISGLIITNEAHELICSELPNDNVLITKSNRLRTLSGPYRLAMFEQPIYLIQQKIGHNNIGIVVLSSILQSTIRNLESPPDFVVLYNRLENRNILQAEHLLGSAQWVLNNSLKELYLENNQFQVVSEQLHNFNEIQVLVFKNKLILSHELWYSQLILSVFILLISALLYYAVKKTLNRHYSLRGTMKFALKNKQFYPVYQPIFDHINQVYSGVEVLLRWQDNQDEIILPDFFIEEAELTGLIIPITLQIIEIAFQENMRLLSVNPDFYLSFNLSALHFKNPWFFDSFYELTTRYTISSHQIIFEITERDLLDKNDAIFATKMHELIGLGYALAIDDYGTGHANISYIQHYPFQYLKIDAIFVQAIGTKAINESLINTIITMGKNLNLHIIAEGVETEKQVLYLIENEVQFLQGWHFSKALNIEQLEELLGRRHHA